MKPSTPEFPILLSVIVPIYNTADYLDDCIQSVLRQSLTSVELILVDDGSTDGSRELAEAYARNYAQIMVLRQERKRQGAARNLGLSHARGRYVAFLDSDDRVPRNGYLHMVEAAERHGSDMVTGILQSFNAKRRWIGNALHRELFVQFIERTTFMEMPRLIEDGSACNLIIRRSFLDKTDLSFREVTAGEDLDFMVRLYFASAAITILPEVVYQCRERKDSRTTRVSPTFFEARLTVTENLEPLFASHDVLSIYHDLICLQLRKQVGYRLPKVIQQSPYPEQLVIFECMRLLARKLPAGDWRLSKTLSARDQLRVRLLCAQVYDALIAFETEPESQRFLALIRDETEQLRLQELLATVETERWKNKERKKATVAKLGRKLKKGLPSLGKLRKKYNLPIAKFLIAWPLSRMTMSLFSQKSVWLLDERFSTSAEDNGYFFFRYLRENHPELPAYYILDRNSPDWSKVIPLGNVVAQYSFRHAWLLARASVLASTDSFRSLGFPCKLFPSLLTRRFNVYLKHAVTGAKGVHYTKANFPYISMVTVTNEIERKLFQEHYGFSEQETVLTGLARFDALPIQQPKILSRKILVAPTWRKWLADPNKTRTSKYFYFWNDFLNSPNLDRLLEEHQYELIFHPHFRLLPVASLFNADSERIRFVDDLVEPLHTLIREADMLITDYSSVMYDFFFQEKPVIAFMFDRLEWETQPYGAPHVNFDRDLAADVHEQQQDLLEGLESYLNNNCEMKEKHKQRVNNLITYRDHHNCQRIFEETRKRLLS